MNNVKIKVRKAAYLLWSTYIILYLLVIIIFVPVVISFGILCSLIMLPLFLLMLIYAFNEMKARFSLDITIKENYFVTFLVPFNNKESISLGRIIGFPHHLLILRKLRDGAKTKIEYAEIWKYGYIMDLQTKIGNANISDIGIILKNGNMYFFPSIYFSEKSIKEFAKNIYEKTGINATGSLQGYI